jgi:hypothetical protein
MATNKDFINLFFASISGLANQYNQEVRPNKTALTEAHNVMAIRAHVTEIDQTGEKWITFFRNEAENAGQRIGVKYAEVFEVVKWLI